MGEKGTIYIRSSQFHVNAKGEVFQDGQFLDKIKIFDFKHKKALERVGSNYYFYGGPASDIQRSGAATIKQGFLEGSNVNPIKNLTALIVSHRSYEAYQKAVANYDQIMDRSSNTIGELRT